MKTTTENTFYRVWNELQNGALDKAVSLMEKASVEKVDTALARIPVTGDGFCALLSEAAEERIDVIESAARRLTAQRFGRTVNLYIPLYLSNSCVNACVYCGFHRSAGFARKTLTLDEVEREGERILREGYRSVLLVAGEDKKSVSVDYLGACIRLLKKIGFVFINIETQPLTVEEYRRLGDAGLDGVVIYQETYDRKIYERVHPAGPKMNFRWRMETPERVAKAGIRSLGMGVLLGLADYRRDAVVLASHIKYMEKKYWGTAVSISFPRIHSAPQGFTLEHPVTDEQLTRLIFAMRLGNPDSILTLSTRETAALRDRLFGAGINQVSAGSKTSPGAYASGLADDDAGEQFPVVDDRSPAEVVEAIRARGLEWVWKDWDVNLKPVTKYENHP